MSATDAVSDRSPIRYPGGKFRARRILSGYVPEGTRKVVSPFLGGGSFELYLTAQGIHVEAYDVFWLLANYWDVLLGRPAELADALDARVGRITKKAFYDAQESLRETERADGKDAWDAKRKLDAAADFIMVNRCSFSGATLSGGFSEASAKERFTQSNVDRMRAFRNPLLTVGCRDVFDVLASGPECDLLFLDPPYMLDGAASSLYGISGDLHRGFDHERLHDAVMGTGLPFVLTYNDCEGIRELWDDARIDEAEWSYGMNASKKSSEVVITRK